MPIFRLTYSRDVVEETFIFVEADDEQLLRRNLNEIEDCLPDEDWEAVEGDGYELSELHKMTPEQVRVWGADKRVYKEHHFHYEDAVPEPEPVDPRQLPLFLGEVG